MQTLLQHKLILVVIALVVAGAVWFGLSSTPPTPDLVPTLVSSVGAPAEAGIVSTLLSLRAVKLEGAILSDPAFLQLKDFSIEIVPEPVGRTNPFAPLNSQSRATLSVPNTQNPTTPNR